MNKSTTKKATFNFTLESECGYSDAGGYEITPSQFGRICAILYEQPTPADTRSTFSGAADYDQTTPFNGISGASA